MASYGIWTALSIFILCTIFSQVTAQAEEEEEVLKCYVCSSLMDEKCGKTWGYDADSVPEKYLQECKGAHTVACQKLENDGNMEGYAVTRSCWKSDSVAYYTPETECKEMHNGYVCYCRGGGVEPCNGKQLLQPQIAVILLGLSFLLWRYVF